jgi:hypothetical protein
MIGSEGAKHVAEAIKVSVLLRLFWYQFHAHLTNCSTAVVCHYPQDMGAMTSLNISNSILTRGAHDGSVYHDDDNYATDMKGICSAAGSSSYTIAFAGIIALASAIKDMRALSKLFMRQNGIHGAEAGKAFSNMLAQNTVLKELDLSSQLVCRHKKSLDVAFAKELAVGISDNGTLTKFDISKCELMAEGGKALAAGLKGNQVITELNISNNYLGYSSDGNPADTSGIIAIADAIPDMGALIKLDISDNCIAAEQERHLQRICVAGGIELAK